MNSQPDEDDSRISRIQTQWSMVQQAGMSKSDLGAVLARAELASRYAGAIYRYLKRLLSSPQDAEDVAQEISMLILNGSLSGADPQKGRFRDYMKTIVINAARAHKKKSARQNEKGRTMDAETLESLAEPAVDQSVWEECLRDDLIAQAMKKLTQQDEQSGQFYAAVLSWKIQNPGVGADELAKFLTFVSERSVTVENARKVLQRARQSLAEILVAIVRRTLPKDYDDQEPLIEQLSALGILEVCRNALGR